MNELLSGHGLYTFIFQTGFSVHFHARFAFWVSPCKVPVVAKSLHKEYIQLYFSGMFSAPN